MTFLTPERRDRYGKKIIAFFVLISFTLLNVFNTSFSYAQIVPISPSPIDFSNLPQVVEQLLVPEELGTIQERFIPSENQAGPLIVYIQNAHANLDSERSTQELIAHFQKELHLPLVLLEGGEGKLDNLFFKSFPAKELKEKLLNDYLAKGDLSGGETASILLDQYDTKYYGIEDQTLYLENKKAFLEAVSQEELITKRLDLIQQELDQKAKSVLGPDSLKFKDQKKAFEREEIDLMEYLKVLASLTQNVIPTEAGIQELGSPAKAFGDDKYPELSKILNADEKEKAFKIEDIDAATTQMIHAFQKNVLQKLPKAKQMEINQMIQMHRIGHLGQGMLVKHLEQTAKNVNYFFDTPDVLKPAVQHAQTISSIQGTKLFEELKILEADLRNKLPKTEEGKDLLHQEYNLNLLRQFSKLEITPEDWKELKDRKPSVILSPSVHVILSEAKDLRASRVNFAKNPDPQDGNMVLNSLFSPHYKFYELAHERDKVLYQNISAIAKKEKAQVALVATGGFHVNGITHHFKETNTPFVLISPKISQFTERSVYLSAMEDKRSFMKYFNGSLWDALAQDYASKLASSMKEEDLAPSLKRWRDRIIQNSIAEGRITQAGSYTKYVDALVQALRKEFEKGSPFQDEKQVSKNEIREALKKELNSFLDIYFNRIESILQTKIQVFGDGLKELWETGDVTPKSISDFFDRVNGVKTSNLAIELALTRGDFKTEVAQLPTSEAKNQALDRPFLKLKCFVREPQSF